MKCLLAYLFIFLGFGLTLNADANTRIMVTVSVINLETNKIYKARAAGEYATQRALKSCYSEVGTSPKNLCQVFQIKGPMINHVMQERNYSISALKKQYLVPYENSKANKPQNNSEDSNISQAKLEEEKRKIEEEKKKLEEEKKKIAEAKKKQEEEEQKSKEEEDILIVGAGTGFFVNEEGYVITNNHVVEICKIMAAEIEGEPKFFKILATDEQNDLAIVKGDYKNKNFLNLSIRGAVFGEDIVAFGYPLDSELSSSVKLTRGIVSSLSGPKNNIAQIQIDAAIQPGNSGGPVLNYEGQVVGVASSGLNKWYMIEKSEYIPENVNFAVAAPTLLSFLKANNIDFSDKKTSINKTQELAKIGMPSTIQLLCLNTKSIHEKYKKNKKYSDVLLKQVVELK